MAVAMTIGATKIKILQENALTILGDPKEALSDASAQETPGESELCPT